MVTQAEVDQITKVLRGQISANQAKQNVTNITTTKPTLRKTSSGGSSRKSDPVPAAAPQSSTPRSPTSSTIKTAAPATTPTVFMPKDQALAALAPLSSAPSPSSRIGFSLDWSKKTPLQKGIAIGGPLLAAGVATGGAAWLAGGSAAGAAGAGAATTGGTLGLLGSRAGLLLGGLGILGLGSLFGGGGNRSAPQTTTQTPTIAPQTNPAQTTTPEQNTAITPSQSATTDQSGSPYLRDSPGASFTYAPTSITDNRQTTTTDNTQITTTNQYTSSQNYSFQELASSQDQTQSASGNNAIWLIGAVLIAALAMRN